MMREKKKQQILSAAVGPKCLQTVRSSVHSSVHHQQEENEEVVSKEVVSKVCGPPKVAKVAFAKSA